jgi:hypothetical protein
MAGIFLGNGSVSFLMPLAARLDAAFNDALVDYESANAAARLNYRKLKVATSKHWARAASGCWLLGAGYSLRTTYRSR